MIALAAPSQPPARRTAARVSITPSNLSGVERLADHAGGSEEHLAGLAADRPCAGDRRRQRGRLAPGLAGEGVGIAGVDHQRPGLAGLQLGAAPFDRRRRALERVNTPATVVPLSSTASSTSVRPL